MSHSAGDFEALGRRQAAGASSRSGDGWALACFDLDGTLTRGTTISRFLGERLGRGAELDELERRYSGGQISSTVVADRSAASYRGRTVAWAREALEELPVIAGIAETVAALAERGIPSLLTTVTWRFAAEVVAERYGFSAACGTEIALDGEGVIGATVTRYFDEHDKLRFVQSYCERHGIALERCVAIGDSRSDLPLFGAVGFSVALNATPAARAAASVAIETEDLRDVLALIPARPGG